MDISCCVWSYLGYFMLAISHAIRRCTARSQQSRNCHVDRHFLLVWSSYGLDLIICSSLPQHSCRSLGMADQLGRIYDHLPILLSICALASKRNKGSAIKKNIFINSTELYYLDIQIIEFFSAKIVIMIKNHISTIFFI